ncbi:MAG TPA: hypothetical protein VE891_10725 [Allosphingosinicella sp.]|nr:hypothetical protein [Allosphingosinicella sp.]
MKLQPSFGLAAAALLLAGAGGVAFAHPHPDAEGDGKVKRVVVIHAGKDGGRGSDDRVRRFEMHGVGDLANCNGGEKIVDEQAEHDGKKTKIFICRKGAPTAADATHLEDALARIGENEHLSDEQKARIETALRSAIDRARSAR